jgi:hypothetical protein
MNARLAACGALLLAAPMGAYASDEFAPAELPGFTLSLPGGDVITTSRLGFAGRHEVRLPGPSPLDRLNPLSKRVSEPRVVVSWNQHGLADGEWYPQLRGTLLKSFPGKNVQVLREHAISKHSWVTVVGDPKAPVGFGTRRCEAGFNVDVLVAVSTDIEEQFAFTRKIIESVRCALTDANRRRPEAATRLPKRFGRVMREQFPTYVTTAGEQLIVNFTTGDVLMNPKALNAVMAGTISQATGIPLASLKMTTIAVAQQPERKDGLLRMDAQDGVTAYVGALWCPQLGVTFLSVYTAPDVAESGARAIMSSISCPDKPSDPPADARPAFDAACKKDDANACQTLRDLAF